MKKAYTTIKIIFILFTLISCDIKVNKIEIDRIADIDIFENYEDNLKLSKDIINQNWNEFLKAKINGFTSKDTDSLRFFANTKPGENKVVIQFRYPKFDKPKKINDMREVIVNQIEEVKRFQGNNRILILKSTKKVEKLITILNNENYSEFYKTLHYKITEQFTFEQFLSFIEQVKKRGFKKEKREYLNKTLIKFNGQPGELADIIEYHYSQGSGHLKYESFNFQYIDGEMELVGYKIY